MSDEKPFFLPFVKKEKLTKDTYTFFFQRNGQERDFIPGQIYEMKLPHKKVDERGDDRVFTISSSPTNKEFITITTRILQSSFKLTLGNLNPGDKVQFNGPYDDLNFDPNDTRPHVFLAGGIGITPYHSIVQYSLDKKVNTTMTLFVSWKTQDEMVFDEFFRNAQDSLESFNYIPTLTEDSSLESDVWDGERGRIDEKMIRKYVSSMLDCKYFFAGPPAMVNSLKKVVIDMGIPKQNLLAEEFEGY